MLQSLLEHPGEIVLREELRARLWPADTFVDFDNGLNNAVNKVRRLLGDSCGAVDLSEVKMDPRFAPLAGEPRFVALLHKMGLTA